MIKFSTVFLILVFSSSKLFAASTTIGTIDDVTGNLIIEILDDPSTSGPGDAVNLWNSIKGSESSKTVQRDSILIKCNTIVTEPLIIRYGSCAIEVKAKKLSKLDNGNGIGALFSNDEGKALLKEFNGSEDQTFPRVLDIKLANGRLWITADHQRKLFAISIQNILIVN